MTIPRVRKLHTILAPVCFCCLLAFGEKAAAQSAKTLPGIIQSGLAAYSIGGPKAAVNAWVKGGPLEDDKQSAPQPEVFEAFERLYGKHKSSEMIVSKDIGATSKIVYLAMNFERGAAFASFLVCQAGSNWVAQPIMTSADSFASSRASTRSPRHPRRPP